MIHEVTMYQAQCDRCGHIEDDYGDFAAMADAEQAIDMALDTEAWHRIGERLVCDECWEWSADDSEMVEKPPLSEAGAG